MMELGITTTCESLRHLIFGSVGSELRFLLDVLEVDRIFDV